MLKRKLQHKDACLSDARDKQGVAYATSSEVRARCSSYHPSVPPQRGFAIETRWNTIHGCYAWIDYFISSQLSRFRAQQQLLDPNPANAVALAPSSSQSAVVFLQANPKKEKEKSSLSCRPVAVVFPFHGSHTLSRFRTVFIHIPTQMTI